MGVFSPLNKSEQKKTANSLEYWLAEYLNARRVPASGALSSWKGDIESKKYLIDSKNTIKTVISVLGSDLSKITREGREANRTGHLVISFLEDGIKGVHYAVVPYNSEELDDYDVKPEKMIAEGSKKITKLFMTGLCKRAKKLDKIPTLLIEFNKITFGTPRKWLILPIENYKEIFKNE